MKKGLRIVLIGLITLTLVACSDGFEVQEEMTVDFFKQLAKGDTKKIKDMLAEETKDTVLMMPFMDSLEEAFDWDYGANWDTQRDTFIASAFESVIPSYEIQDIEEKGNDVVVKIKGKRVKYEELFEDLDLSKEEKLMEFNEEYITVEEDYTLGEYTAEEYVLKEQELYDVYAKDYFGVLDDAFKDLKTTSFDIAFIFHDDDGWVLNEIDGKKEWPEFYDYDITDDNIEYEYITYPVDPVLCRKENTKLGKGRLLDSYANEKEVETSLNFIDFNARNGMGEEIDDFGELTFSEPITLEIEVLGNVGDSFYLVIEDNTFTTIRSQKITLSEVDTIITEELTGLNPDVTSLYIQLSVEEEQDEQFGGNQFGYYFVWKKES